jgi:hypothetical protein
MSVRAKFKVDEIRQHSWSLGLGKDVRTVVLVPVTSGSEENKAFYAATPSGKIELATINAEAAAQFKIGSEVYIDFTSAD